jgi:hypothetical protein
MNKKISQFDEITAQNNNDWLLIEEDSTGAYKKITVANFLKGIGNNQIVKDSNFLNVVLLMPMDGANESTDFTDLKSHTFTTIGSPRLSSSQFKFGSASAFFNGSSKIFTPDSEDWNFGNGDFTIELWLRLNNTSSPQCIIGQHNNSINSNRSFALYCDGNPSKLRFFPSTTGAFNSDLTLEDNSSLNPNGWHHIRVTRGGSNLNLLVDGIKKATNSNLGNAALFNSSLPLSIGSDDSNTHSLNAFVDDLRITKGVNRDAGSNFSLPTSASPTS